MVIEQAESGPDHHLSIALRVPCNPKPRSHVVIVPWNSLCHAQCFFRRRVERVQRRKQRRDFHVVPHSIVDGHVPVCPPTVLKEQPDRKIVEWLVRLPDALNVRRRYPQSVRLQSCGSRKREFASGACSIVAGAGCRAVAIMECVVRHRGCCESAEVDHTAVIQLEYLRLPGSQLNQVVVPAHLECVISADQAHVIREFESPLDAVHCRVRLAPKVRETGNVHADVASARKLGESEMQSTPRYLGSEFVKPCGAQNGVMLEHDVEVPRLVYAGTRSRVLSEGLVLRRGLNPRHQRRRHSDTKERVVLTIPFLVQPQRPKAGLLRYRKVSAQRIQRLIRSGERHHRIVVAECRRDRRRRTNHVPYGRPNWTGHWNGKVCAWTWIQTKVRRHRSKIQSIQSHTRCRTHEHTVLHSKRLERGDSRL